MRVLFITSRLPADLRRGDEQRAYQHLRYLALRHDVTLLVFDAIDVASPLRGELESLCRRVVYVPRQRLGMLWRVLAALPGRLPLQAAMNDAPALRRAMAILAGNAEFDLAHVQLARLGPLLPQLGAIPCVLDLIDALSLNMHNRARFDRGPSRWLAQLEAGRLADYERDLCARVSAATVSSARDRVAIGADLSCLHVVGNGVDLNAFEFSPVRPQRSDVVFIGNLGYFPNVDAVTWFADAVLPLLQHGVPDVAFNVVGARPARALQKLAQHVPALRLVGPVSSVWPALTAAAVAVAPMRAGSGQQIKILEAMAAGTPLVATPMAAAGLEAIAGEHLLVAESGADFAAAVIRLLTDRDLAQRIAANARRLIEQRYTWQHSALALEQCWLAAVSTAPVGAAKITAQARR